MAKKKVNKKVTEKKKPKSTKYTLDTPIVKEFIKYIASKEYAYLRQGIYGDIWENITSQETFLKAFGLSENSRLTLYGYKRIKGFDDAVEQETSTMSKGFIGIANLGLYKRAKGMNVNKQMITKMGAVIDTEQELEPDTKACVEIHKIFGKYTSKVEITDKRAIEIKNIAESMGDENDD